MNRRSERERQPDAVTQDGQRSRLHLPTSRNVAGLADQFGYAVHVDAALVEEPKRELLAKYSSGRRVELVLRDGAAADQIDDQFGTILATKLVDPGFEGAEDPLFRGQFLEAPGGRRHVLSEEIHVVDDSPVGGDNPVEAEPFAQDPGNHVTVEAEPDPGTALPGRHAVGKQDLTRTSGNGSDKWRQVLLHATAGVVLLLAVHEARILAVALGTTAREVLGHRGDARIPKHRAVQAAELSRGQGGDSCRVRNVGARDPHPPWLGGKVCLRVKCKADSDSQVVAPDNVGEAFYNRLVPQGSEADRLGPGGKPFGDRPGAEDPGEGMARVGRNRDRDPQTRRFCDLLHAVVPAGNIAGI